MYRKLFFQCVCSYASKITCEIKFQSTRITAVIKSRKKCDLKKALAPFCCECWIGLTSDGDTEIPCDFRQDKWKPIKAKLTGVTQSNFGLYAQNFQPRARPWAAAAAKAHSRLHYSLDGLVIII